MGEEVSVKYCYDLLGLFANKPNRSSFDSVVEPYRFGLSSLSLILVGPKPRPIWQDRDYFPPKSNKERKESN